MSLKRYVVLVFAGMSLLVGGTGAEIISGEDPQTGLKSWEWREAGISVQLVQRLPDQTRAFFLARGFDADEADVIGRACVFQTIFRNDGEKPLSYDLDDWQISYRKERRSLFTREHWGEKWRQSEVSKEAGIALRWSLLPTRQKFQPGDYNWGMTSFGLAPGEVFDLTLAIRLDGDPVARTIPGIVCAADEPGDGS